MIHTVFFDAGGTVIDAPDVFLHIASQVVDEERDELARFLKDRFLDLYLDASQPFRTVQELMAVVLRQAANNLGVPDASDRAPAIYRQLFLKEATAYADSMPALTELEKMGVRMIIISDADASVLYEELDQLGLSRFFDGYVISSEVQGYKPSAAMVNKAREFCREPMSEIMLVGDTLMDVHTAHKLGVQSVHIDRRNQPLERADHVITSLLELPDLINRLRK